MDFGARELTLDGTPVLSLRGSADIATLPILHQRLARFAAEHHGRYVVVDLDELDGLEPVALGALISARLASRRAGGDLDIVCTAAPVRALFEQSGLDATFPLHRSIAAAVLARDNPSMLDDGPL